MRSQPGLAGVVLVADLVNINDVLDGHVTLDLDCLDRIYLNAYVPNLQVGGQVVTFLTQHLGYEVPPPAIFKKLGDRFRAAVVAFAEKEGVLRGVRNREARLLSAWTGGGPRSRPPLQRRRRRRH